MIEILLKQDIDKLGKQGDIVRVADGYARNFLFPRKFAAPATKAAIAQQQVDARRAAKDQEQQQAGVRELAERIEATSCTVTARAGDEGHLFGSVTEREIVEALNALGFTLDESMIQLEEHIKDTGVFTVPVRLTPEITCTARVWVVAE